MQDKIIKVITTSKVEIYYVRGYQSIQSTDKNTQTGLEFDNDELIETEPKRSNEIFNQTEIAPNDQNKSKSSSNDNK